MMSKSLEADAVWLTWGAVLKGGIGEDRRRQARDVEKLAVFSSGERREQGDDATPMLR